MKHIAVFFVASVLLLLCSCREHGGMRLTYDVAGENRSELEAVVDKYATEGNREKKRAAEFLLENMAGHYTKTSVAVDSFTRRMMEADTLTTSVLKDWWEDYRKIDHVKYIYDAKVVRAEYLVDNIEAAYKVWQTSAWKAEVSEELFLNYVLPYRLFDEALSPIGWRDTLYRRYHSVVDTITDLKRAYHAVYRYVSTEVRVRHLGDMPYLLSAVDIGHIKRGRCQQQCAYIASVMRALGIPAVVDGITCWANYGTTGHSWVALVVEDGTYTVGIGDSIARKYNPINSSSFTLKYPVDKDYPLPLDFVKTVPKIWRPMYAMQKSQYSDPLVEKSVSRMFSNPYYVDVSADYGLCGQYDIRVPSAECAYLCTFATGADWRPVAYARRDFFGRCRFTGIADSVVYLPMVYSDGQLTPVGTPFYLVKGEVRSIVPDSQHRQTVTIARKYPFAKSILRSWAETQGASIVASNHADFASADTLLAITGMPLYRNVAHTDSARRYRYVKYVSHPQRRGAIAELCVYSGGKRIKKKPFSTGVEEAGLCFDGNTFTLVGRREVGYAVGLDMGRAERIDSVALYLKNDGNYIDVDDEYELLHYDNKWLSLGRCIAVAEYVTFKDVPVGALLLLRNHSKGHEERIFTYENGKQMWW